MNINETLISSIQRNKEDRNQPLYAIAFSCSKLRCLFLVLILFASVNSVSAQPASKTRQPIRAELPESEPVKQSEELPWLDSLAQAYQQAQQKSTPIFVRFEGTFCPYCKVLDDEIKKPIVQKELKRWTLVRLDVDKTPSAAQQLLVGPIPALRLLTPAGKLVVSQDGAMPAAQLVEWLQGHYESAAVVPDKSLMTSGPPDALSAIRLVKQFKQRDAVLREAAIQRLIPYPDASAALVVNAFSEGSLSSQLAALELLREWKAPIKGLDPWNPQSISAERLKELSIWITESDLSQPLPKKKELTPAELESCQKMISSILSATPEEARAVRERLSRFGSLLLPEVTTRLKTVETDEDRERLTALRYRLVAADRLVLEWPGGIERLAATDVKTRQSAIDELSKRANSQEEELLLELFSDPAPLVREMSLRILREVGGSTTNSALIRLLNDPEPNVRAAVLKQLSEKPSRKIVPKIAEYVKQEKDPDLVVHAVRLFREAKGKAATQALLKLLSHSSWRVRAESAEAISKAIDRYASDKTAYTDIYMALIELLEDEDSFVVSRAVTALSSADLVVAVDPLIKAATQHPSLAAEIVKSLSEGEKKTAKTIPHLRKFCKHEQPEVRAAAITGLCSLVPTNVKDELRQTLKDPASPVRIAAANAFFAILSSETIPKNVSRYANRERIIVSESRPANPASRSIFGLVTSLFTTKSKPAKPKSNDTKPKKAKPEKPKPENPTSDGEKAPADTNNPDTRHTQEYEKSLADIRSEKIRKKWMFELAPLLETLLNHESAEERLAGSLALAGLGQDKQSIPQLRAIVKSHPQHIGTIARVLPWLLWDDRIQLFQEICQSAKDTSDLHRAIYQMSEPRDHRALVPFWDLLAREDVNADLAGSIIMAFSKLYFDDRYYDLESISVGAKKRAVAGMIPRAESGPHWQRIVALVVLFSLSREDAETIANTIVTDESTSPALLEDAFQILLASQKKSEATQTALKGLSHENPKLRRTSLAYLSAGPKAVTSIANEKLDLKGHFYESRSSQKSGIPIVPEAPEELDEQTLLPMLNSSDPQTAAYAGYLLVLSDNPDGFSPLIRYWTEHVREESLWTNLVFRAIAYSNDSSYVPLLETIYKKHIEKNSYSRNNVNEFYWTIRIMSGPEILALRKRIRDEVGMDQLR